MANKDLFTKTAGKIVPKADTINSAGGKAYSFTPEHALAQYATTGCLSNTYYADAKTQLADVLAQAQLCSNEYIAKCAVYARQKGHMKDMPALLCAILAGRAPHGPTGDEARMYLNLVFPKVIDNGKMLRNFVQILRSGVTGRKSMGHAVKRLVGNWFDSRKDDQIFRSSVGKDPTLTSVISLAHVKAGESIHRQATFKYLFGAAEQSKVKAKDKDNAKRQTYRHEDLPELIQAFEAFKKDPSKHPVPDVPFDMLTALPLTTAHWTTIALQGSWHFVRMNLNTFERHGVLKDAAVVKTLAAKLSDEKEVARARIFPYQLLMSYQATEAQSGVPMPLKLALQDALEHATKNVPSLGDNVWVFPDVSGSMSSPVTGLRGTATTATRCVDVAGLFAACVLRNTPGAQVIPVDTQLHTDLRLNPRDSVMTNAQKLAKCGGGGTSLSLGLDHILKKNLPADTIIFFSDNESWADRALSFGYTNGTAVHMLFAQIVAKNPKAKMVCIDLQPNKTTQAKSQDNILNIGGFSDNVWTVLEAFTTSKSANAWVDEINKVQLVEPVTEAKA
jgi:60 kDa SS-A/Ro ribonucleoprotein